MFESLKARISMVLLILTEKIDESTVDDWFWERVDYLSDEVAEYLRGGFMKEDEVFVDFEIRKEDLEDDEENLCAYCLHGLCADVCKECLGLNWK